MQLQPTIDRTHLTDRKIIGQDAAIDFTRSVAPRPRDIANGLVRTLSTLSTQEDVGCLLDGSVPGGAVEDRVCGARLLSRRFGSAIDPDRIIVTNGTQSALHLLFRTFIRTGGTLLSEALSYGVLKGIARQANVRLESLALDHEGITPEAVVRAFSASAGTADLLYCNPTIHNPTTSIMSIQRRKEIAALARTHSFKIVEDDVLGLLHPEAPPPLAALAPDITWYVMGLTKCLAHGMRIAYLLAPSVDHAKKLLAAERTYSSWFPAPLQAAVVRQWIKDGTAEQITSAIRSEMDARHAIARQVLAGHTFSGCDGAMHIWLKLPHPWSNREFEDAARRRRVLVRTADRFAVDDAPTSPAIRLSLSSPPDRQTVASGLATVAALLDEDFRGQFAEMGKNR
ncbi:PLP-dependent aminotransferase family protein (plasmid) [Mesorhizobium sp. AR10]|uniref:aminotransferase-like domain-containing protein n=1 Tax=Mesorhizobium sp. AR10 TaxID=2865839 RepID=UPI00215F11A1|nr:PLP-dependent aminotransferase family protein [Mesorhizobium sp. AR10]UVK35509.1 PLP-dependent aminotransferase family protein [Mesorhizobium sp. AR10]